jgi:hypothetical protein
MVVRLANRDCSGVLKKEREILEATASGKTVKSCLIGVMGTKKRYRLKQYFSLVDELVDLGVPIDQVYRNLPRFLKSRGERVIPNIHCLKTNSPLRRKAIDFLFDKCSNDTPVDVSEYIDILPDTTKWTKDDYKEHYKPESIPYLRESSGYRRNLYKSIAALPQDALNARELLRDSNQGVPQKLRLLRAVSDPLFNHCEKMNAAGYGDNPYAALAHLVKFWNEGHPRATPEGEVPA